MKSRIALAMLLVFGITLVVSASASAVVPIGGITVVKSIANPGYFTPGATIPYRYAVSSHEPYVNVVVTDDMCSSVNPVLADNIHNIGDTNLNNVLNGGAGEVWQFTCNDPAPAISGTTLVNTATVRANLGIEATGPQESDTDTYTLYGFTLRKNVGLYNNGSYPDFNGFADTTPFTVEVYNDPTPTPTPYSFVKVDGNLTIQEPSSGAEVKMWVTPGVWKFLEVNLPQGYVPVDWMKNGMIWTTGQTPADNDQSYLNVTWSGCSLGHWKNTDVWPYPYYPDYPLDTAFNGLVSALAGDTFIEALNYGGGPGVEGGQMILLKQAVAALLNEEAYGSAFGPYLTTTALINAVNDALDGPRGGMISLAETLDYWNNGICREWVSTQCPTIPGTYNSNFVLSGTNVAWQPSGEMAACLIPSNVTVIGNITMTGGTLRVNGDVTGNLEQFGDAGGLVVQNGANIVGNLTENGVGFLRVDDNAQVQGIVTEYGDGDIAMTVTAHITGDLFEWGNGNITLAGASTVTGSATENGAGGITAPAGAISPGPIIANP